METKDYLDYLVNEIHTVVMATVDNEGNPVTSAIDMMDHDGNNLYFLTARGKSLYERLVRNGDVSLTGIKGKDTLSSVSVSIRGKVRELGFEMIPQLFEKNPYMKAIYPNEESMQALTVFQIYEAAGEWFDLSTSPIERASFRLGHAEAEEEGYFITDSCIGCGTCLSVCPQQCISSDNIPFVIRQENCLRCGNCFENCPVSAVEKR